MTGREDQDQLDHLAVVPTSAGPVRRLSDVDRPRDEVDLLVDDLFGEVDEEGPGVTDAVLLTGGLGAVVASQLITLPGFVLVAGIGAVGVGAILPARSLLRRVKGARRQKKIESIIGDGQLLDTRDALIVELLTAHAAVFARSEGLSPVQTLRSRNAAHGLLEEVASLLDGHRLGPAEAEYVGARVAAMRDLATALRANPGTSHNREAQVKARIEVEARASTSALADAHQAAADIEAQQKRGREREDRGA